MAEGRPPLEGSCGPLFRSAALFAPNSANSAFGPPTCRMARIVLVLLEGHGSPLRELMEPHVAMELVEYQGHPAKILGYRHVGDVPRNSPESLYRAGAVQAEQRHNAGRFQKLQNTDPSRPQKTLPGSS